MENSKNNMKILEYRYINTDDIYDMSYDDGYCWSRVYEYPLAINTILKHKDPDDVYMHNTSWGFEGVHIVFKNNLEKIFKQVLSSDIRPSNERNTTLYDITKDPPPAITNGFDVVLNISTMEEVDNDHIRIFNNLFKQVKPGGLLVCTFDIPGLQIEKFNELLGQTIEDTGKRISGITSKLKNERFGNLNCGILAIEK